MKLFKLDTIRKIHNMLVSKQKPEIMAIDATGIDSWQLSRHYAWRIGEPYIPHAKLDALIDVKDSIIFRLSFLAKAPS